MASRLTQSRGLFRCWRKFVVYPFLVEEFCESEDLRQQPMLPVASHRAMPENRWRLELPGRYKAGAQNTSCMASNFYVYLHKRKSDGRVFYVGKGSGKRAYLSFGRSDHWKRIVCKHGIIIEFVEVGIQEWYAFELERDLISLYGRENLCNQTDGGDGMWNPPEHFRKRMSQKFKGVPQPWNAGDKNASKRPEVREKISSRQKGKVITAEQRESLRKSNSVPRPWISGGNNCNAKKVKCVETALIFNSLAEAAEWIRAQGNPKASHSMISRAARGICGSAYGFRWEYLI